MWFSLLRSRKSDTVAVLELVGGAPGGGDTARRRFIGGCRFFHNVASRTAAATLSARRGPTSAATPRQRATMSSAMARSRAGLHHFVDFPI